MRYWLYLIHILHSFCSLQEKYFCNIYTVSSCGVSDRKGISKILQTQCYSSILAQDDLIHCNFMLYFPYQDWHQR